MSEDNHSGMSPRDRWLACNPDKTPEDWAELIRRARTRKEMAGLEGLAYTTDEKRKADQRERQRRHRARKKEGEMSEREIRSVLIIVTPDGRRHGQHLTDAEAAELCRRLLEIREGAVPEAEGRHVQKGARPAPRHAAGRRKGKGTGRPPKRLDERELSAVDAMRQEGLTVAAIARATHHSAQVIRRELERLGGA